MSALTLPVGSKAARRCVARSSSGRAPAVAVRAVSVGEKAPDFALKDQSGKLVKLSSFSSGPFGLGSKPVVIFFYPADGTPGCTKEACAFRDAYSDFVAAGAAVFGISGDDEESHQKFKEANNLPFPLLVDEGDAVRTEYGIKPDLFGLLKGRQTFVIDKTGTVVLTFNDQFGVEKHVSEALEALAA